MGRGCNAGVRLQGQGSHLPSPHPLLSSGPIKFQNGSRPPQGLRAPREAVSARERLGVLSWGPKQQLPPVQGPNPCCRGRGTRCQVTTTLCSEQAGRPLTLTEQGHVRPPAHTVQLRPRWHPTLECLAAPRRPAPVGSSPMLYSGCTPGDAQGSPAHCPGPPVLPGRPAGVSAARAGSHGAERPPRPPFPSAVRGRGPEQGFSVLAQNRAEPRGDGARPGFRSFSKGKRLLWAQ